MSVSSVKNLNGNEFSAVQDTSLTEFVQTNSASWGQGGADTSNIFYITKGVTPFSEAISAAKEGKTLIGITSGGGSIGTVTINDLNTNSPWLNICLFGDAGYQGKGGGGEKQWYSKCQLYTFSNSTGPGWYTEGGWYNEGHPQSDWNDTNGNSPSFIRNKPVLSAYAYTSAVDNKLDTSSFSDVSSTFLTAHQDISNLMPKSESANFYPMTGNPSGFINELPDEEEVEFEELDLGDYALASALDNKQNLLTDITDVQVVQSLPISPVSSVLYLIPEV